MLKRHAIFTIIFVVVAVANIIAESYALHGLKIVVKPLICISLAAYQFRHTNRRVGFNRLIFTALILSLFGDCFLLLADQGAHYFIYGLLVFLAAHVTYSLAFFRDFKNDPQASKIFGHLMLFLMGVLSLSYYSWIREYLDDLRIAVMAYMFAISIMIILTGYRYKRVNLSSFTLIYAGAIFFVISDSILAYNKFVVPFTYSGVLIISTYMSAQYLITVGTIERKVLPVSATKEEGTLI